MRKFLLWFGIGIGIIIIFLAAFYLILSSLLDTEPYVAKNSYLTCGLWGTIPEYTVSDALEEYLSGAVVDMAKLRRSFRMAAVDDRIKGMVLRIGFMQVGYAKLQELQQMIAEYRSSGKKIYAFLDMATTGSYFLASACDSVYLQPGGTILLTGVAAEITFYKDLLNKIGVEADFEHVGKYKSYPEPYTRQSMSGPLREVINDLLENRYRIIIAQIAENRGLPVDQVERMINEITGFTGKEALEYGLIDGLRYESELAALFKTGDREPSEISVLSYADLNPRDLGLETGARMALIYCSGSITGGEDGSDPVFGSTVGASRIVRNLESAARNSSIKAIILRIDSPGGSGIASEKIWHSVKQAARKKPVIASISDVGASGGYYIAIGADTIIAQPASLIGSIGVFIGKFSFQHLYEILGINVESVKRGENARMFTLSKTFSSSERAVVKKLIEDSYQDFVSRVAESRRQTYEQIDDISQGRVWTGDRGLALGLIDTLGGLQEAIDIARKMTGLDEQEDVNLVIYPRRKSLFGSFFRYLSVLQKDPLSRIGLIETYFRKLQLQPLTMMPYQISIN
jgi:protease-4